MVIEYDLVKRVDLCFARPKIHRPVGTRLVICVQRSDFHISRGQIEKSGDLGFKRRWSY
jgi:hypothetical protein